MTTAQTIAAYIEARAQRLRDEKRQGDAITLEAIASDIRAGLHEAQPETAEAS